MDLALDWENLFTTESSAKERIDSISDALIMSLSNFAKVDMEYISSITGKDYATIISELKGSIYQNPETWDECEFKGWETSEEYLSGNLMRKLRVAMEANEKYIGCFEENLYALMKLLPDILSAKDIYITLGSPWVPTDVIDDFITHIMNIEHSPYHGTKHDEHTGTWEILSKTDYLFKYNMNSVDKYGTARIQALYILEKTLNMKTVVVTDKVSCTTTKSGEKRIINKAETVLALERQKRMIKEFQSWVWKDEKRKERLEKIFDEKYGCIRRRVYDGSFLKFPTMSSDVELYPYQKNAIARILFSPNTLLAHDVGSGKTYIMIAAGMELKRMGLSKKSMYVVPNNIVGQWKSIFNQMYPSANILCVEPKNFTVSKRKAILEKIRDEEFDGIIIAASCFELIPLSKEFYIEKLKEEEKKLQSIIKNMAKATSRVYRKNGDVLKALSELVVTIEDTSNTVFFDELGVTRLFVDEAHNYKNVPIDTKVDMVLGISSKGSKKCKDMLDKVHMIQKQNNGGGVVMATGTPITNSITDAYVMQLYLQSGELAMLDLQNFDSWVGMFAERVTEFEIDVDTSSYRMATRFSKFHNLPELTAILSGIADFHQVNLSVGIPEFDGYSDALISKTDEFEKYLKDISVRAENVRKGYVRRTDDNMLMITTDGRKAALDIRLVNTKATFDYRSKVARCVENIFDIYDRTSNENSAQLIFCDTSTPKEGFNLYDEIKMLLVNMGISEEKIAFIHDADTESKRNKLFAKVRKGEVRVLIGSTFKLGLGVNVQDKLIAIHHLDVPWRPADMTQREGRILRQGNKNKKVFIYRYITEGSFDAYSWQLLETKQRFISGLLSGALAERSGSDIENTVLDYAEVKALAIGNPLIKQRVEIANELTRYMTLQKKIVENYIRMEKELLEIPERIKYQKELINKCKLDMDFYSENKREYDNDDDKEERRNLRKLLFLNIKENELKKKETFLFDYQGFKIILPANMKKEKAFVWIQKNGRYYVELGDTEIGAFIRIDNYLDNFDKHLKNLEDKYRNLCIKEEDIKRTLDKKESYTDKIEELKDKIKVLDEKLGVKVE